MEIFEHIVKPSVCVEEHISSKDHFIHNTELNTAICCSGTYGELLKTADIKCFQVCLEYLTRTHKYFLEPVKFKLLRRK